MKKQTFLKRISISAMLLLGATLMEAEEVKIIDENIQSWKSIATYADAEQTIRVGSGEGTVSLQQVEVVKSRLPTGIDNAGVCSDGYIQLSNLRSPKSSVKLPVITGGVSKIELNIITTANSARTVDVLVEENESLNTTFSGLSKTGATYTASIGTTGNTTIIITNVTGGLVYVTDIKVYQNQVTGEPNVSVKSDNDDNNGKVFVRSGILYIMMPTREQIDIFDLTGRRIQTSVGEEGLNTIELKNAPQFVIVKAGNRMFKLASCQQ